MQTQTHQPAPTPTAPVLPEMVAQHNLVNYDCRSGDVIMLSIDGAEEKPYCVTATFPNYVNILCAGESDKGDCKQVTYEYLYNHGATYLWKRPNTRVPNGEQVVDTDITDYLRQWCKVTD